MGKDAVKTALNLVKKSSKTMVGSIDENGYPNVKVMFAPRESDGVKEFYFSTNTSSLRVAQFSNNPKATVYFYDGRFFRGLMLLGKMEVIQDQSVKDRIWREGDTMYYPLGVTDPDYCVLKFSSESGRLYENFSSVDFEIS